MAPKRKRKSSSASASASASASSTAPSVAKEKTERKAAKRSKLPPAATATAASASASASATAKKTGAKKAAAASSSSSASTSTAASAPSASSAASASASAASSGPTPTLTDPMVAALYHAATDEGGADPKAQYLLSEAYRDGRYKSVAGLPKSMKLAAEWCMRAAECEDNDKWNAKSDIVQTLCKPLTAASASASILVGAAAYHGGTGSSANDKGRPLGRMLRGRALWRAGYDASAKREYDWAVYYYKLAAEKPYSNTAAMCALGELYLNGRTSLAPHRPSVKMDGGAARDWYRRAAMLGSKDAIGWLQSRWHEKWSTPGMSATVELPDWGEPSP